MAWETRGKPQPLSLSEQTRSLRMVTVFLSQWLLFGCRFDVKMFGILCSLYNKCCQIETPVPMISRFTEQLKHSKLKKKKHASEQVTLFFFVPETLNREP